MATELRFLTDAYQTEIRGTIKSILGNLIVLDRTVFYPGIGVTPGDCASLIRSDGVSFSIVGGVWTQSDALELGHVLSDERHGLAHGDNVVVRIDWSRRHTIMRTHTALHAVSAAFPFRIVGGRVGPGEGTIDFLVDSTAMSTSLLQHQVQRLVDKHLPVESSWAAAQEIKLDERSQPFSWPGRPGVLRMVQIGNFGRLTCDGLHVRNTREIGPVVIKGIVPVGDNIYRIPISLNERRAFPFLAHVNRPAPQAEL
ncbi:alanyl-tRNA editing protein [Aquamicrobium sp. NLF2-7]|uniref:alanyl-tRNA editing protein n=1 Tax=Aquamicrobium sp. NLF2-7 TaxID=2918753 RepID=UPI001EFA81FB|nr:alanyl-tRNA editing protein [Aquamicrobium sp. NLF2-7]MCG8273818.1 alanyl-tRNA editing protein [Aquamicrobium sp. NLF2-7]MCG8273970.1 alanyl-tRNA editing protein [Aquamicrobium sp. NLF2-7]